MESPHPANQLPNLSGCASLLSAAMTFQASAILNRGIGVLSPLGETPRMPRQPAQIATSYGCRFCEASPTDRFGSARVIHEEPLYESTTGCNGSKRLNRSRGRAICRVQVPAGVSHSSVAEGNCVVVRRGGEQPEENCRSVG